MNMRGPDAWIVWANLAGAAFAVAVNVWSARKGWADWAPLRYVIAIIGSLYVIGYVMLLSGAVTLEVWSRFFRGVSPVAWVTVWAGPPLFAHRITQRLVRSTVADNDAEHDRRMEGGDR